jgi:hypothetical protein
MDPMNEAAAGGREETSIAVVSVPAGEASLSARAAARNLAEWRHKRRSNKGMGPRELTKRIATIRRPRTRSGRTKVSAGKSPSGDFAFRLELNLR